jgi:aryl-alcohol dehydrogenase-like predicted oxidoreductase
VTDTVTQPLETPPQAHRLPDSVEIGTGTWQWGDTMTWGYGRGYGEADVRAAFTASIGARIRFFDTAELDGWGTSERLLGRFIRETGTDVQVATKFLPYPWRLTRRQLIAALRGSLKRLGMSSVELYQIHFPLVPGTLETWANALADALDQGLTRTVGVSNYNWDQTERTHAILDKRGYPLASNQVEYSLLDRRIERDGTMRVAHERGIKIIAYSPLGKGLLTGKYTVENPPPGMRGMGSRGVLARLPPLIERMRAIGEAHADASGGKSAAQVAINWTICKGTLPIPGAKNAQQVQHNAGSVGWRLTDDEVAELDRISAQF